MANPGLVKKEFLVILLRQLLEANTKVSITTIGQINIQTQIGQIGGAYRNLPVQDGPHIFLYRRQNMSICGPEPPTNGNLYSPVQEGIQIFAVQEHGSQVSICGPCLPAGGSWST